MKCILFAVLFLVVFCCNHCYPHTGNVKPRNVRELKNNKIIIEGNVTMQYRLKLLPNSSYSDVIEMNYSDPLYIGTYSKWRTVKAKVVKNRIKWILNSDKALLIQSPYLGLEILVNPGDSICVNNIDEKYSFSGRGSDLFRLQYEIKSRIDRVEKPLNHKYWSVDSLGDYFEWNDYLDKQLGLLMPLIDSFKNKISGFAYDYLKINSIKSVEWLRIQKFIGLIDYYKNTKPKSGVNPSLLNIIWDSLFCKSSVLWLNSQSITYGDVSYFAHYIRVNVWRKYSFDLLHDSLNTDDKRRILYYNYAKEKYNGHLRERVLVYIIANKIIKELDNHSPIKNMVINDYYNLSGFQEYKKWIKEYQDSIWKMKSGKRFPEFKLMGENGMPFSKDNLKGKITLVSFWNSECNDYSSRVSVLNKIKETFMKDTNVVFVSILFDSDKIKRHKSISRIIQSKGRDIYLYIEQQDVGNSSIKDLYVSTLLDLYLLDEYGKILQYPPINSRQDIGVPLINLIVQHVERLARERNIAVHDGPYILYKENEISVNYIRPINGIEQVVSEKRRKADRDSMILKVRSNDFSRTFTVQIKKELQNEPSVFERVNKQIVISDIEGEFDSFRKLLQSNKVIDSDFNWKFGKGHLILNGDFFDRGEQVIEVLWLIYSLEEKAKEAGGYVHFILGNHEIMNLQNDIRYVRDKYKKNAKLMGVKYVDLFGEDSELGRWLRTKNIMEKIGDILYVHGGVSPKVNQLPLSISQINNLTRSYYGRELDSSNKELLVLYNQRSETGRTSPFWFRGYYGDIDNLNEIPTINQVDSTLEKFNVAHIVTGHSVKADTVNLWYNNRVINVDTRHAKGKSEALFIEGDEFFRVNDRGNKVFLFKSQKQSFDLVNFKLRRNGYE